jgi:hypothetical protein
MPRRLSQKEPKEMLRIELRFRAQQKQKNLGFARLLPIYTAILGDECKKLRELTLHQEGGDHFWDDDVDGQSGKTDD